jgi:hypothetical protein
MDLEAVKSKWGQCTLLNAALFHAITVGNSWHQGDVIHTAQASMPRDVGSRLNWPIDRALAEPGASNAKPLMRTASSSTWARCGDGGCLNIGDG